MNRMGMTEREYDVCSAVLAAFFCEHDDVAILGQTGCAWRWEELGPRFGEIRVRRVMQTHPELVADFRTRNAEPATVVSRFVTSVPHRVVPPAPGTAGWRFSRVGFSADGHFAVVLIEFCGRPKISTGMAVLCELTEEGWRCEKILEFCS